MMDMETDEPRREGAPRKVRAAPLLPEAGAAGTPLTLVIAILAFMAGVALIANLTVSRAVKSWTGDLTGTVTVQIRGPSPEAVAARTDEAQALLAGTPGVLSVDRLDREETEALLEPWFDTGLPADIPVPGLVTARIAPDLRADLTALRAKVAKIDGAALDDHGAFNDRLVAAAARIEGLALLVFAMVMLAGASVIVFASRAGLAANKEVIEVLHLVGATNDFIAGQVQRRYFSLGLKGGLAGAVLAGLVLLLLGTASRGEAADFIPDAEAGAAMIAWLAVVPLILCATAAISARIAVLRSLKERF